jgi:hypothetical protein
MSLEDCLETIFKAEYAGKLITSYGVLTWETGQTSTKLQSSSYHGMLDLAVYTIFSVLGNPKAINAQWLLGAVFLHTSP